MSLINRWVMATGLVAFGIMAAIYCAGIAGCTVVPPPVVVDDADAAPPPTPRNDAGMSQCEIACSKFGNDGLKCEFAQETPGGRSCATNCQNMVDSMLLDVDFDCVMSATSCGAAESCLR
jgi:hypothetical protein